jgi:hypothetical protein
MMAAACARLSTMTGPQAKKPWTSIEVGAPLAARVAIVRHVLDEPRGHAPEAPQEDYRHLSANGREHRSLDTDTAIPFARLERYGKAVVAHAGAAAPARRGTRPTAG